MSITITPFRNQKSSYGRATPYNANVNTEDRLAHIVTFIADTVDQLRDGIGPSGISLGEWKGTSNHVANFVASHGLLLDYHKDQEAELIEAASQLGFAHFFMDTENKKRTINAVTLCIPFSAPVSASTAERIACCVVTELDVYGLLDGALAATHIVDVHWSTCARIGSGTIMDAEAYKRRTAYMYQDMDAKKYCQRYRPVKPATLQIEKPVTTSSDGLWIWPATPAEQAIKTADDILASIGVKL